MNDSMASATVLCIDDEANILSSLKRLFRPAGYRVLTADNGQDALDILEKEANAVDVVISDMRMPGMDGIAVLGQVRRRWPDVARILLTGYADIESTVAAVNEGQILRYISKPWNDSEVALVVRDALERRALEREKARLEQLTREQNEQLKALNNALEEKVQARTQELCLANERLKRGLFTSIQVFANLIELREGTMAGHSGRVADLARRLAQRMGRGEKESQDIFLAALLHDIGKIGLPDSLLNKPVNKMSAEELGLWRRHPIKGEQALMGLEDLRDAAKIIRAHRERYDGRGYPDGLSGLTIPFGARILAVANEFDEMVQGTLNGTRASEDEARQMVLRGRGSRYDPQIVDALMAFWGGITETPSGDIQVHAFDLQPGMVLAKNLVNSDGVVLLTANYVLDEGLIGQLQELEHSEGRRITLCVQPQMRGS